MDANAGGSGPSDKSRGMALALAVVLGPFGAHRFYVGKQGSGALMLCTLGGLGIWYLYDVMVVAGGSFRDVQGRLLTRWEPEGDALSDPTAVHQLADEVTALRGEVADLAERLDFTERLLAQPHSTSGRDAGIGRD